MIQIFIALCILVTGMTCSSKQSQDTAMQQIRSLPGSLDECSGMASLGDGWYVAHNDSGNPAELFVFKLEAKSKTKTIKVKNSKNVDWEELAEDENYIYIGDFGNNSGKRKDLGIYRVKRNDLTEESEVEADWIGFSFSEQNDFISSKHTNFDCEAMVCIGDSLYLFTKNHGNLKTNLYSLSKIPGDHHARLLGEFDAGGLITGADYRLSGVYGELVLLGYTDKLNGHSPFVLYFTDIEHRAFFNSRFERFTFNNNLQVESILFESSQYVLLTSEGKRKEDRKVYRAKISN